jgi:hypothetical protein
MKKNFKAFAAIAALPGLLAGIHSVAAHHSAAMYDDKVIVAITGTIKEVRWVNPHASVLVYGTLDGAGEPTEWLLETTSPGRLTRLGWTRTSFNAGDRVVVEIHPLRDTQQHGGSIQKITSVATGKSVGTNLRELDSPERE